MSAALQFGQPRPELQYEDRRAAFGIAVRDGKIACVRITRTPEDVYLDLPGGALDPGETEEQGLIREFGEETGLLVQVDDRLVRARQYFVKADGRPVNNQGGIYLVAVVREELALKIEDDHALVWCDPVEAMASFRHGSHAYAVAAWLNLQRDLEEAGRVAAGRTRRPDRQRAPL